MMKILSPAQVRQADAYTIQHEPITSVDLMERAAAAFVGWFIYQYDDRKEVNIFCGRGNNGGDGFAIARLLLEKDYKVNVYLLLDKEVLSADCEKNYQRLKAIHPVFYIRTEDEMPDLEQTYRTSQGFRYGFEGPGKLVNGILTPHVRKKEAVLIDAIVGSGLEGPLRGLAADVIARINQTGLEVVAVDIASGLIADKHQSAGERMKVAYTVAFQSPKLAFFMPENLHYVGEWSVLDIGLSDDFMVQASTDHYFSTPALIGKILKKRTKFSHKGDFGKVLLIAGSKGKMGAAILSASACLRTGTGLLTVHVPSNCWPMMQTSVQEAMVSVDEHGDYFSSVEEVAPYDVIGLGPGLGTEAATTQGLAQLLENYRKPIVFDADALNILAKNPPLLKQVPAGSILTPHPKEFERLAGTFSNDYDRLQLQKKFASKHNVYVVLKGAHTSIATPAGEIIFNTTGNVGMATAGSGDVLTGIITSLLGQGYRAWEAAVLGVYLHGVAGDKAAAALGQEAMLASDIVDHLAMAYQSLHGTV